MKIAKGRHCSSGGKIVLSWRYNCVRTHFNAAANAAVGGNVSEVLVGKNYMIGLLRCI